MRVKDNKDSIVTNLDHISFMISIKTNKPWVNVTKLRPVSHVTSINNEHSFDQIQKQPISFHLLTKSS